MFPSFTIQPRPVKLTLSQCKNRVCVSEWVMTSCKEASNPAGSGHCCFSSGEEFLLTKKPKLVKKESKLKAWNVEMFLKWCHLSAIFHYSVNFIGRTQSGKFRAWFYGIKALLFFGSSTFLDFIEIPKTIKTLLPIWTL